MHQMSVTCFALGAISDIRRATSFYCKQPDKATVQNSGGGGGDSHIKEDGGTRQNSKRYQVPVGVAFFTPKRYQF